MKAGETDVVEVEEGVSDAQERTTALLREQEKKAEKEVEKEVATTAS